MSRITRMEIDLELARQVAGAAIEAAITRGALISVAVVDAGGQLICFECQDGAEIAGPVLAPDKAYTAVAHRARTDTLAVDTVPGGPLQGLAAAAGGRFVCFGGGLPFWAGDRVVGGVGVSGGTTAQDVACAEAAARVFDAHARGSYVPVSTLS